MESEPQDEGVLVVLQAQSALDELVRPVDEIDHGHVLRMYICDERIDPLALGNAHQLIKHVGANAPVLVLVFHQQGELGLVCAPV